MMKKQLTNVSEDGEGTFKKNELNKSQYNSSATGFHYDLYQIPVMNFNRISAKLPVLKHHYLLTDCLTGRDFKYFN